MIRHLLTSALAGIPLISYADTPVVVVDLAPVHSLVSQIMEGVATPVLLLPPGADPHHFSFRPSDAQILSEAHVVIGVGAGLTPWLEDPLDQLATEAMHVMLAEQGQNDWGALAMRGRHLHEDEHDEHDEHAHADGQGKVDPHGWMSPLVASAWVKVMVDALVQADPDNRDTYQANGAVVETRLATMHDDISAALSPIVGTPFLWPHDGYQYFEATYDLNAVGTVATQDGASPGPQHIADLRAQVASGDIQCLFWDATVNKETVLLVAEGSDLSPREIDGVGINLQAGSDLYEAMLMRLTNQIAGCRN